MGLTSEVLALRGLTDPDVPFSILRLSVVEDMLRDRQRLGGHGTFLAGAKPTHADFALFAYVKLEKVCPRGPY